MRNIDEKSLKKTLFKWFSFWILFSILIFGVLPLSVCVLHEPGHYIAGKLFGCSDLIIECPALFGNSTIINYVDGWKSCPTSIVLNDEGARVCNLKTLIVNFSGFALSLIILFPLFLFSNYFLRKKTKKFYFDKKFRIFILLTILVWALKSSSSDLLKIVECINPLFAQPLYNFLFNLPDYFSYFVLILFVIDIVRIIFFKFKEKGEQK